MCTDLHQFALARAIDQDDIDGWTEDCSNSIANELELPQSCTKPLIWQYQCLTFIIQIKICAEYRDMLPRPRLVVARPQPRCTWQIQPGAVIKFSHFCSHPVHVCYKWRHSFYLSLGCPSGHFQKVVLLFFLFTTPASTMLSSAPLVSLNKLIGPRWCHITSQDLVSIGLGNGLLPDSTKPWPEPVQAGPD